MKVKREFFMSQGLSPQSFPEKPLKIYQPVIFNLSWLTLTEALTRLLKFFLFVFAARVLGVNGFGVFSFCLNLMAILALFCDFGLFNTSLREFSRDPEKEKKLGALILLKIILSTLVFLVTLGLSQYNYASAAIPLNLILLSLFLIFDSLAQTFHALFRARGKTHYEALCRILEVIITVIFGLLFLTLRPVVVSLSESYVLGALVCFLTTLFIYFRYFGKINLSFDWPAIKEFLSLSWPVAFLAVFYSLYHSLDSLMLGLFGFINETGWYNAAYKLSDILILPALILAQSFYPVIARYPLEKFGRENIKLLKTNFISSLLLGLIIGLVVFLFSFYLIFVIYGQSYLKAVPALQVLMLVNFLIYLSYPLYQWLISQNQQKISFFIALGGVIFNFSLNLILIPRFTFMGAAWATFFTYLLDFAFSAYFVRHLIKKQWKEK